MQGITPGTTISIAVIFSLIAVISQIMSIWGAHKKNQQEDEEKSLDIQKNFITINLKLDQMTSSLNTLIETDRKRGAEMESIRAEMVKIRERQDILFHYKDEYERRMQALEQQRKT